MRSKNAQEENDSWFPHVNSCTCPECQSEREREPAYSPNPTPTDNQDIQQSGPRREYKSPKTAAILATLALIIGEVIFEIFPTREIGIVTFIVAAVMFLRWQVRCSMNLQPLGANKQQFSPSAGVMWWFIPLANLALPVAVIGEIWRRSHPNAKPGWEPGQPGVPKSRILIPWWLAFAASRIIAVATNTETTSDTSTLLLIYGIATLIALVLVIVLIWQITLNQAKKRREQAGGAQMQPRYQQETRNPAERPRAPTMRPAHPGQFSTRIPADAGPLPVTEVSQTRRHDVAEQNPQTSNPIPQKSRTIQQENPYREERLSQNQPSRGGKTMPYTAEISRTKPGCFLFMVDQSGSMKSKISGTSDPKQKAAADAVNRALQAIAIRCSQGEEVRDYFHIGIIGYSTDFKFSPTLDYPLQGATADNLFVPISEVVNSARIETKKVKQPDGAGGIIEADVDFPVWLEPKSHLGTPMTKALETAKSAIVRWIQDNPESFPPILINISDGEASDGDPVQTAQQIMSIQTQDGSPLLFNVHLSERSGYPVTYPSTPDNLPNDLAKGLFEMSSILPPQAVEVAQTMEILIEHGARGYVFNADMVNLVQFLEIGTRASQSPGAAVEQQFNEFEEQPDVHGEFDEPPMGYTSDPNDGDYGAEQAQGGENPQMEGQEGRDARLLR